MHVRATSSMCAATVPLLDSGPGAGSAPTTAPFERQHRAFVEIIRRPVSGYLTIPVRSVAGAGLRLGQGARVARDGLGGRATSDHLHYGQGAPDLRRRGRAERDVFVLSDVADLVPTTGADGRPEQLARAVDVRDHEVVGYRPGIEGLRARIERWRAGPWPDSKSGGTGREARRVWSR